MPTYEWLLVIGLTGPAPPKFATASAAIARLVPANMNPPASWTCSDASQLEAQVLAGWSEMVVPHIAPLCHDHEALSKMFERVNSRR